MAGYRCTTGYTAEFMMCGLQMLIAAYVAINIAAHRTMFELFILSGNWYGFTFRTDASRAG